MYPLPHSSKNVVFMVIVQLGMKQIVMFFIHVITLFFMFDCRMMSRQQDQLHSTRK